jgi:hypothetical protein
LSAVKPPNCFVSPLRLSMENPKVRF